MPNFPDDFERQLRQVKVDVEGIFKYLPWAVAILLLIVVSMTSWFKVDPQERAVVLRFGKYNRTMDSGLHFKLPMGIESVEKVDVMQQRKEEFGFRTAQAGVRTEYVNRNFDEESLMLTGDLNVANVEWVTQYRINEPENYLFNVRNVGPTFRLMNEAVLREIIGDRTINEVLTIGRSEIEIVAKQQLQQLCKRYNMGLSIDQVILQDVSPPEPVRPAFNAVNQAQQQKETMINQAQQEYNKVIPKARGDADRTVEEAEGYAVERVNRAQGEANRFIAVFKEYQNAQEVTRQRMYLETMDKVLNQVGSKTIIDDSLQGLLPLLNLNPEGN